MNSYDHILAKSVDNGGTCLRKHLESVAKFIVIAARFVGVVRGGGGALRLLWSGLRYSRRKIPWKL